VIFLENPTYFLAIKILNEHGFSSDKIVQIPVDSDGISVDSLEEELSHQPLNSSKVLNSPKRFSFLLYLVPTYSNPTGTVLAQDKRVRLASLAKKFDMLIVCDDMYQRKYVKLIPSSYFSCQSKPSSSTFFS
jgi:DNA-binding transcriptional MocR family regulator